jgi:hypothetical protein
MRNAFRDGGWARGSLEWRFAETLSRTMRHLSAVFLMMLSFSVPFVLSAPASAQGRPSNLEPLPDIPPPPPATVQLAPGQEPEVRIIRRDRETVEEFRIGGQLYMLRVTPAGGVPFYLIDYFGDGVFTRTNTFDSGVRVPMWVIRSW